MTSELRATVSIPTTVRIVQVPTITVDQWGTTSVTYQPMEIIYGSVTLPTMAHYPRRCLYGVLGKR